VAGGLGAGTVTAIPPGESWPDESVVVATKGRPQLLARAVASILSQGYPGNLECVLVFDQQEPEDVPVEVPDGRQLRALANTRTPGLAGARNTGITSSGGAMIAFCDDDDSWPPGKLTLQVGLLEQSAASFVASGIRVHHGDNAVVRIPPAEIGFTELIRDRVTELHPSTFVIRRQTIAAALRFLLAKYPDSVRIRSVTPGSRARSRSRRPPWPAARRRSGPVGTPCAATPRSAARIWPLGWLPV
jgi:glycosyltransferase involved in cell wall biosynthesis